MFKNVLLVITGGGIGSACRYGFSHYATRWFGDGYSWGTLGVNWVGCLLIGIVFSLVERSLISHSTRLFLMTGFLGGLTTFSAFGLESLNLLKNGDLTLSLIHLAANNIGGIFLVFVGIWLGHLLA